MSQLPESPAPESILRERVVSQSLSDYLANYWKQVRSGDVGVLPIILGLIVIALIFQSQNDKYLTPRNLVNLSVQMAGITTIAIGVVYVLLLGEIDLSIGYVSAVAAVFMTMRLRPLPEGQGMTLEGGWPWFAAIVLALLAVAGIGMVQGMIITRFRLPSFVVTLAGLLVWNGAVLILIGDGGTVIIQDQVVINIANYFMPDLWGWITGGMVIIVYTFTRLSRWQNRQNQGVSSTPLAVVAAQISAVMLFTILVVYVANEDRGVPVVGVIILILLVFFSFLAERTKFGRYVYAIGGNIEAARRAGINVNRIRIQVFMISSLMAGMGGIVLASRLQSVDTGAGGGNLLLNSIAAAVIGGTSLFGGSGKVSSALLGALVIMSVENGMGLLGLSSGVKFVVTGSVLLIAVLVDALTRQGRNGSA